MNYSARNEDRSNFFFLVGRTYKKCKTPLEKVTRIMGIPEGEKREKEHKSYLKK